MELWSARLLVKRRAVVDAPVNPPRDKSDGWPDVVERVEEWAAVGCPVALLLMGALFTARVSEQIHCVPLIPIMP